MLFRPSKSRGGGCKYLEFRNIESFCSGEEIDLLCLDGY